MTDAEIELLIQRRAHELWEREGRPEDFALRHWLDAERRVREEVAHAAEMREAHAVGASDAAALSGTGRFRTGPLKARLSLAASPPRRRGACP